MLDMYVVGVFRIGKNIAGFKILALKSDSSTEVKDVDYNSVRAVIQSGKGVVKNLKLVNGELKGVNGSLERYGEVNKSQALVIINEIQSDGKSVGYLCSDTNGNTRQLTENQIIMFADKFGIANGKLVPDANGERHLSAIDGTYDVKVVNTKSTSTSAVSTPSSTTSAGSTPHSNLPESVLKLIKAVKSRPEYSGSYAEGIVKTIEKNDKCSDRQKEALESIYKEWVDPSSVELPDNIKDLIDELRKQPNFDVNSTAAKIANSVESNKRCSARQKYAMEKELEALKKKQKQASATKNVPSTTPSTTTSTPNNQNVAQNSTNSANSGTSNTQTQSNTSINNKAVSRVDKNLRKLQDDYDRELQKAKVELERKSTTRKQKRRLTQNIMTDGLFDYSITRDGRAYVEGFTQDAEIMHELVIPDTTTINGKTYKVTGISNEAFMAEPITSLTTGPNISDIGQYAFTGCSRLQKADLSKSTHTMLAAKLFKDCVSLSEILPGNYIQRVHEYALSGCKALKAITLPACCDTVARYGFYHDVELETVNGSIKNIQDSGFSECFKLENFNFSSLLMAGPSAFRRCGFKDLVLPSNIRELGEKAFSDNYKLQRVELQEGIEEVGKWCFAKEEAQSEPLGNPNNLSIVKLDELYAPKSLKIVDIDAFRHVGIVIGWTGTVAESKCFNYGTPFKALDALNEDNSTKVRIKSALINMNPIEALKADLENGLDNESNPEFVMKTDKLINIPFDNQLGYFGIDRATQSIEPHIKFKAVVNYLQDRENLMTLPLEPSVLRLQDTFYMISQALYDDGCNKIYKVTYRIMDTLEFGSFIIVLMNNNLRYITDCNLLTDLVMNETLAYNDKLPVRKFLHSGDVIGEESTISGHDGIIRGEKGRENIGKMFYKQLNDNAISIFVTKRDEYMYVPAADCVLNLHDKRGDNLEGEKKVTTESKSVIEILSYDEFLAELKNIKKNLGGYTKFFKDLKNLSDAAVRRRISDISTIEDEKEAQLFLVSKQFNDIVDRAGQIPNPNMLTIELFNELATSYWMISKDQEWLRQTGTKSLNQTAVYHIGKYTLTEFKSNQIVKFSNPYMNGKKGAYVFTLQSGNTLLGVYASRYTMQYLVEKLYDLTNVSKVKGDIPAAIMQNPAELDLLDPNLFYKFYDVLQSKNGWAFNAFNRRDYSGYNAEFGISMYKPNGIFYLTVSIITTGNYGSEKVRGLKTVPILPIGNMDRALMVATTTNTNGKDTKLYNELMNLGTAIERIIRYGSVGNSSDIQDTIDNYTEARRLVMAGIKDVAQYKKLIDDRAVYMLGTVHKGELQREKAQDYSYDSIDDIDIAEDIVLDTTSEEFELDTDDIDLDDDIIDLDEDTEEFDLDEDEEGIDDSESMSFEEFFETAKSMGVTDENQARAMYVNFMNQQ